MWACICSSVVERQLPKLNMRVRFPSGAPNDNKGHLSPFFFYSINI